MIEIINTVDWAVVIFIIATGEFLKHLTKDVFNKQKFTHFWQIVVFITPLTALFVWYFERPIDKALIGYFVAFWLYQAIVKKALILLGIKKLYYYDELERN